MLSCILSFSGVFAFSASGQTAYSLSGTVRNQDQETMTGAVVQLNKGEKNTISNEEGRFSFSGLATGQYHIRVSFVGYKTYTNTFSLNEHKEISIILSEQLQTLHEVCIIDHFAEQRKREVSLHLEIVSKQYLRQHLQGDLGQTLERLPGVSTIGIGSAQSKPVIRGLSFNRILVVENGIAHQGQQWGSDHGLEIDQYAAENIEVIKGPASLQYGAEAIGGVIRISNTDIPEEKSVMGSIDLIGNSNNNLIGSSASVMTRNNSFLFGMRGTLIDYADYRIPTDSVDIYSYRVALHKNRLRNTAGREKNLHITSGIIRDHFISRMYISNLYSKAGFFANAHGLEPRRVDTELHDASDRDIRHPFHEVNHLKIISKNEWKPNYHWLVEADLGYQNNQREERSMYTNHGHMPAIFPDTLNFDSDLERTFDKEIYTGHLKTLYRINSHSSVSIGINPEFQDNKIGGTGFIIPEFTQFTTGSYLYVSHYATPIMLLHAGLRYDHGKISTKAYHDWFFSPQVSGADTQYVHLQRASSTERTFNNLSWSLGINYNPDRLALKANAGKSFRMPTAKELGANGVNYHRFSYEKGNAFLSPEISYQFDVGAEWHASRFAIGMNPFVNYFPNYIYLNPTHQYDRFYGGGNQVFEYTESEVIRWGGEVHTHYSLTRFIQLGFIGEYIYAEQLSGDKKGFALPFSPPPSGIFHVKYLPGTMRRFHNPYISADYRIVARQERIVPPEEKTDGYALLNISIGSHIGKGHDKIFFSLQIHNVLNTIYYKHTHYYRLINVPGAGRSFLVNITVPFSNHKTTHGHERSL